MMLFGRRTQPQPKPLLVELRQTTRENSSILAGKVTCDFGSEFTLASDARAALRALTPEQREQFIVDTETRMAAAARRALEEACR